tara:strand:- start:721 stop:1455 length:735 start_codon:yes stop_codon:yes gene_type:complete
MSFLPEINMSFVPSDNESEEDEVVSLDPPEGVTDVKDVVNSVVQVDKDVNIETGEEDPQFMYEDEDKIVPLKLAVKDLTMNDIFQDAAPQPRLTKKGKPFKKRPPLSDAHKEKLKAARVKAIEVRRQMAAEKKEAKDLESVEKDLLKKQRVRKVQKLKEEVDNDPPQESVPFKEIKEKAQSAQPVDVEKAVIEGITKYELIRKLRKKEKREQEAREKEENLVRETLRRAVAPTPKVWNPYSGCY